MSQSTKQQSRQHGQRRAPVVVRVGPQQWVLNYDDDEPANDSIYHDQTDAGLDPARTERTHPWTAKFPKLSQRLLEMESAAVRLLQTDANQDRNQTPQGDTVKHPAHRRSRLRESFQVGLIIGLILGCLSLVMFHQVEPSSIKASPSAGVVEAASSQQMTLPAVTIDRVVAGAGLSLQRGRAVQDNLEKHGIPSSLWHRKNGYDVVTAIGVTTAGLSAKAAQAASVPGEKGAHIDAIHVPAAAVPASASLSQSDANVMSAWLSAVNGSLNTIVAVSSDHASLRDATAAYQSAHQRMPAQQMLKDTGYDNAFTGLINDWTAAYNALSKKQMETANADAMNAIGCILQIENT